MAANKKRLMITVPLDMQKELDRLKDDTGFTGKKRSEMLRQLIRMGLETAGKEDYEVNMFVTVGKQK